ncbi:FAD-dependent oxidoreductase [Streptomyces glaucus]|uniref:FAD/NAD(P)-binding domain-containing protein n=1 Tax=Streptomyces glaucus TaxID=284029 RepID=A0ABP5XA17_9ACTN
MTATVAVVGGGYGGVTAAKALDDVADVVLIEPRDAFVHNVAALRGVTDQDWAERLFIPYDKLLTRGTVKRDRAVEVTATTVRLASGETVEADYIVLATGSTAPYPANIDALDRETGKKKLDATRAELELASHVLLLGAGPVGLEFAGEIKASWPDKAVTVVDPQPRLLSGASFPEEFHTELRAQLDRLGVVVLLGTALRELPSVQPGAVGAFTVTTDSGDDIAADIWFRCYGTTANSDILGADLGAALRPDRRVAVTPELRVQGLRTVFAVGDLTALPELKMARLAQKHAEVVAGNIRTLIEGGTELTAYQPEGADSIVLPLGPEWGVTYAPEAGVLGASVTADIKGTFFLDSYRELLNQK